MQVTGEVSLQLFLDLNSKVEWYLAIDNCGPSATIP